MPFVIIWDDDLHYRINSTHTNDQHGRPGGPIKECVGLPQFASREIALSAVINILEDRKTDIEDAIYRARKKQRRTDGLRCRRDRPEHSRGMERNVSRWIDS